MHEVALSPLPVFKYPFSIHGIVIENQMIFGLFNSVCVVHATGLKIHHTLGNVLRMNITLMREETLDELINKLGY